MTTVTFGLVKKTITLKEGDYKDFEIALNEEAAALNEKVTIVDNPFETTEASAASEQTLNKRELQELSTSAPAPVFVTRMSSPDLDSLEPPAPAESVSPAPVATVRLNFWHRPFI